MVDEAGFDVLIGSAESQVPSALYSEKAYVMSKGFVKTALTNAPLGLADVIQWLYLSSQAGPCLLRRILNDSKNLLANNTTVSVDGTTDGEMDDRGFTRAKLSAGASILLRRHVDWLEDFVKQHDAEGVALQHPRV